MNNRAPAPLNTGLAAFVVLGLVVLLTTACATAPRTEDDKVVSRAQERWDAIVTNDLETAYGYYTPGYRSSTNMIDFAVSQRIRKVAYTSAEYIEHDCEGSRCTVKFDVGFRVAAPVPGMTRFDSKQVIEDTWVKTSGEWWYLPKN